MYNNDSDVRGDIMDFLSNINLKKNMLTKNELKACELISQDLNQVQLYSLTEISKVINVSKTTILRFCQKMGYSGYTEFKYDCVKYVNSLKNAERLLENENSKILNVEKIYMDTIKLLHYTLKDEELNALSQMMRKARKIRCVGEINSEVSSLQLKYALAMFGIDADVLSSSSHVKAVDLITNQNDLLIIMSASAKSHIVGQAFELKKDTGCQIALVTMNPSTPLEKESDLFLLLPSVSSLKNKSLLDSVPIFTIFVELLLHYLNDE